MPTIKAQDVVPPFPSQVIDLNRREDNNSIHTADAKLYDQCLYHSRIDRFLLTGKTPIHYGGWPMVVIPDGSASGHPRKPEDSHTAAIILKGIIYYKARSLECVKFEPVSDGFDLDPSSFSSEAPLGFVMDYEWRTPPNEELHSLIAINGDEEFDIGFVTHLAEFEMPVLSLACLAQFFPGKRGKLRYETLYQRLASNQLRIVDYTPDEMKPLTPAQKKVYAKVRRRKNYGSANFESQLLQEIKSPALGFTLIQPNSKKEVCWHRASTVLIWDNVKGQTILMGRDDDTYFGCQLPKYAESIADAYHVLTPKEVIGKKGVKRQGEWFMLPVDKKKVPEEADCVLSFYSDDEDVSLPLQKPGGNRHFVHTYDGRVGKDGTVYAEDVSLCHEEHEEVYVKGWCTFHRNTAVRSFSQEGVD